MITKSEEAKAIKEIDNENIFHRNSWTMYVSSQELLDTPYLRYLKLRENFLQKYQSKESWGKNGSKQRIIALNDMENYLEVTRNFFDFRPEEQQQHLFWMVFEENMNLVFKDDALPNMPISLRQRLKFKKVPEALVDPNVKKWEVARISKLLCEEKHNTLKMFTTEEQSRVNEYANYSQKSTTKFAKSEADMNNIPHEMSQAAFELRKLCKQIYVKPERFLEVSLRCWKIH